MNPVLVVVDVQNGFIRPASQPVVPVIANLVRRWRADLLFTRYWNYPNSPYERLIGWQKMTGPPSTDIVAALEPFADNVLDKTTYSPFPAGLDQLVDENGWSDLYICGIATESCVCKTAVDAFERDLTPWVIADASASHAGPEVHNAGLLVTRRFIGGGQIINTADLPRALVADSQHTAV